MTKKTLLIILLIIIFIALDVVFYVFFFQNRDSLTTSEPKSPDSIFPTSDNRPLDDSKTDNLKNESTNDQTSNSTEVAPTSENGNSLSGTSWSNLLAISLSSFKVGTTTQTFILDKPSGNIFAYGPDGLKRLTNTTFPGVEEVIWGMDKNGLRLILRRSSSGLFNNASGLVELGNTTEVGELQTNPLSDNLLSFAVSPTKDRLFVLNGRQGGIDGYVADFNLNNRRTIFSSALSEWLVSWPNQTYIALQTKPAADVPGFLFFLNVNNSSLSPVIRNVEGLSALVGPDANKIIYSRGALNSVSTYLYDYKQDKSLRLSISTLPEKCLWAKTGEIVFCAVPKNTIAANYPDDWHQGKIQFSDNLWSIDATNGNVTLITDSQNLGDLINLSHNEDQNQILAIDRNTKKVRVIPLKNQPL